MDEEVGGDLVGSWMSDKFPLRGVITGMIAPRLHAVLKRG